MPEPSPALLVGHSDSRHYRTLEWICKHYSVPAKPDGRVVADGKPGRIVGTSDQYLLVLIDGEPRPSTWHPTWHMEFLDA